MSATAPDAFEARNRRLAAIGWGCFAAGFLAAYFLSTAIPTPVVWYYPVEHRFALETRPTGLAADYYGRLLLALAAGSVASLIGRAAWARSTPARQSRAIEVVLAWCAVLLLFTAGLYVYLLVGRTPLPAPLPPGYTPR